MNRLLPALVLATLAPAGVAADPPPKAPAIEGTYTIVAGEDGGQPVPAERLNQAVVRITKDLMLGTDKDKKEFFGCTYTLDVAKTPWAVHMKTTLPTAGTESDGLLKQDGDTVTLVYNLPGTDAPIEFKTKKGQHLFVMKKQAAK